MSRKECDVVENVSLKAPLQNNEQNEAVSRAENIDDGNGSESVDLKSAGMNTSQSREGLIMKFMRAIWLPSGWPHTVTPEYATYAVRNIGRNAFRKANFVLGTSALLHALGLSSKDAITVSAALNWILKDGAGMVAKVSISSQISRILDRDPKLWRVLGDFLMVLSVSIELSSPLRPRLFFLFGSLASLLRQAADAMSGPAYRVFLYSFAINSNIGDVSSRAESQVVLGNLLGLAVGAAASAATGNTDVLAAFGLSKLSSTTFLFGLFSVGHLASTRLEVGAMCLRTLNWKRTNLILEDFVNTEQVPNVQSVNHREPLFVTPLRQHRLRIGGRIADYTLSKEDICRAVKYRDERYMLALSDGIVGICLHERADNIDVLRALLQGQKALQLLESLKNGATRDSIRDIKAQTEVNDQLGDILPKSRLWIADNFGKFMDGLDYAGWNYDKLLFYTGFARYVEGAHQE